MNESRITPNILAFLALSNEYCQAVETSSESDRETFTDTMLRLLPRIYISVGDIRDDALTIDERTYLREALEEEYYETVRRSMEAVMGEEDTYLEVFEENMVYSDTPIAASIAENLADIFQVLYNLIENVKDANEDMILEFVASVKEDFGYYWSKPLCNVLRALNTVKYKI